MYSNIIIIQSGQNSFRILHTHFLKKDLNPLVTIPIKRGSIKFDSDFFHNLKLFFCVYSNSIVCFIKEDILMNDVDVSVKNFQKTYNDFIAVAGISFEVLHGEIFGLLGPNGAGKTSTLECLEGLRTPNGGTLRVAGIDPTHQFNQLRSLMGVQLQIAGLPPNIHVDEAMDLFCAYHKVAPRYDLLERLDLMGKGQSQYIDLSAGQQRRLALALAVAHNPRVLFLDEPTAGLDVASRAALHDLMRELKKGGTTIILATHDMAEAEEMADRIAILLKGKIVIMGTPLEVTASGAGLSKITVNTENDCLSQPVAEFPAVDQHLKKDEYSVYYQYWIDRICHNYLHRI
jgi:ABC-2 type transport system ATP-binding protein